METVLTGTILGKFLGSILITFLLGSLLGIITYIGDKKKTFGKYNFIYSYIVVGVTVAFIWGINISIYLLS